MNDRTPTEATWLLKQGATPEQALERIAQRIAVWRDADPDEDESWESFYSAAFDMLSAEVDGIISAVAQPLAASPPAPAAEVEPVAWIPASQIDELRELAGGIDLEYWSTKVIHAYVLPAEGRIPVYLSPPPADAIRAQARREALEEAAKEMDRRRDDATGICSPRVTYSNAARAIRALAGKGEVE
jgi:hypothetical protein